MSKLDFSVLRLDKNLSRACPQNAVITRNWSIIKNLLTSQQQNGRTAHACQPRSSKVHYCLFYQSFTAFQLSSFIFKVDLNNR